jgi:hypothetical protein
VTVQPFSKLTLNGGMYGGLETKGLLNYNISKDIIVELDYAKLKDKKLLCLTLLKKGKRSFRCRSL